MTRTLVHPAGTLLGVLVLAGLTVGPALLSAHADDHPPTSAEHGPRFEKILVVDFEGEIDQMMWAYVARRIDRVEAEGFDCLVLRIDSPGGTVFHSIEIADRLHDLPDHIHVVAWIPKQALSGACMVSMACDEILMGDAATLGDCQPIVMDPAGGGITPVGEKMESPLRALFEKYATKNGYPVLLAKTFVSAHLHVIRVRSKIDGSEHFVQLESFADATPEDEVVAGHPRRDLIRVGDPIVNDEQLLTVTTGQARALGFVFRFPDPNTESNVLAMLSAPDGAIEFTEMSFSEKAGKILLTISGVLSAIVALAIMYTLFHPTFGVLQIAGIVALVLIVLINLTADQLNGFPIFLILVGVLLLVAEVFLIPGFGVAGILGIGTLAAGFLFLATGTTPGETNGRLTSDIVIAFALQFVLTAIASFVMLFMLSKWFPMIGPGRRMMLAAPKGASLAEPDAIQPAQVSIGAVGTASSALRPAGTATFDGEPVDVVTSGGFVPAGSRVRVLEVEGARVTVEHVEAEGDA